MVIEKVKSFPQTEEIVKVKEIPQEKIFQSVPVIVEVAKHTRIQTAEGWKRSQLKRSSPKDVSKR